MNLFDHYNPTTSYDLLDRQAWQAIPLELRPLYTLTDTVKIKFIQFGTSPEPFTEVTGARTSKAEYLRVSVAQRLAQAAVYVQQHSQQRYNLYVTEAFRPMAKQRDQYEAILQHLSSVTNLTGEALHIKAVQFIANPELLPPHVTGGTVDITLCDNQTGEELWMGTPVDAVDTPLIHSWHCNVAEPERVLRQLLYNAMTSVGFLNFPLEWWHYSYGDLEWALHHDETVTIYDAVETLTAERIIQL